MTEVLCSAVPAAGRLVAPCRDAASAEMSPPFPNWPSPTDARRAAGLTVTQLARRVQVARSTVSMWESGTRAVGRHHWPALGDALGMPEHRVAELFAGRLPSRHDGQRLPSLALARRRAGFTQREMAGRLGVAASTLSMWESGSVPVSAHLLDQVAQVVATDLVQLAGQPLSLGPATALRPLREHRKAVGMSRKEAADLLGIAVGSLSRYEAGERVTPVRVARRMAVTYRRRLAEVLEHSGHVFPPLPAAATWRPPDVPRAVRSLRLSAGWTKSDLGRALGRSAQAVRNWEKGYRLPPPAVCRRMEIVFRLASGTFPTLDPGPH